MKESGLHLRIEPTLRQLFVEACQKQDLTASQVIRAFMRRYVDEAGAALQQDLFARLEKTGEQTNA